MSMLSAQIDKLRYEADMLRDHGTFIGYGGLTSTDPEMIECADLMCDAADTIWQLRDDLQRANEVLRDVEHDESVAWDRVCKAEKKNAKLLKLVRDMHKALFSLNLDHCQACPREDACVFMHKSFDCGECAFERDMRELGVEVP